MFEIMIITHGDLAKGFLSCAEMFTGKQDDIKTYGLHEGDSPEFLKEQIEKQLKEWNGKDVVALTDIRSGTPFNVTGSLMQNYHFNHISGINLAMLIEIITSRSGMTGREACDQVMNNYQESIIDVSKLL